MLRYTQGETIFCEDSGRFTGAPVQVGTSTIQLSAIVRDLGFHLSHLDSELCMKQHVAKMAAACFYHLRHLRQIRRRVEEEVTTRLYIVIALVISRLDYCNSLLARLPLCTIEPLQRVQNAAARLIFELSPSEHITPSLLQLPGTLATHTLAHPVQTCFMHAVVTGRCPAYLRSIVQPADTQSRSGLRPSSSNFSVPWTRTNLVRRAGFLFCRPVCVEHTAAPYPRNSRLCYF